MTDATTPATTEYDVIVIGAGAVGENVADRVVQGGLTALIIEAELVGGDCSYWACMPSKALLRGGIWDADMQDLADEVPTSGAIWASMSGLDAEVGDAIDRAVVEGNRVLY